LTINLEEIINLLEAEKMHIIPGTDLPHTWLGVPMLVGSEVKGIVSLQNLDRENAFSPSDIDLLTTLTNSMSASLENARLFNETQRLLGLMEQEMAIARQTQQSILPMQLPSVPGYDFGSLMMPARTVCGDFYDFIPLENQKICIVIGDASDKGLPAALFMAMTFSLMRAEIGRTHNPRQILRNVNRYLTHMKDARVFVTVLYAILDIKTGEFSYARAGHLPPILLDWEGNITQIPVGNGQPLGMLEDVQIDEQRCILPCGGLVLMHSDGLNEAVDAHGEEFGLQRVQHELVTHRHENAQTICEKLWHALESHSGENLHQDDFTALIVKREG
jgi:serine phosphatase RsbU (regulator of sigma subunit)